MWACEVCKKRLWEYSECVPSVQQYLHGCVFSPCVAAVCCRPSYHPFGSERSQCWREWTLHWTKCWIWRWETHTHILYCIVSPLFNLTALWNRITITHCVRIDRDFMSQINGQFSKLIIGFDEKTSHRSMLEDKSLTIKIGRIQSPTLPHKQQFVAHSVHHL